MKLMLIEKLPENGVILSTVWDILLFYESNASSMSFTWILIECKEQFIVILVFAKFQCEL